MRIYKIIYISIIMLLLSGCSSSSLIADRATSTVEVNKIKDNTTASKETDDLILINQDNVFPQGQGSVYFPYTENIPVKISFSNTGTKSFIYKIKNIDQGITVNEGTLKSNESYEQIYEDLVLGDYIITYVVEDENKPFDIKLTINVELLP